MLRTSIKKLAVGSALFCSTVSAQNWYPTAQQPMPGADPSTQGYASGFNQASPTYHASQQMMQQSNPAGQYQLPAPSAYQANVQQYAAQQYAAQQYASAAGQVPYAGQVPHDGQLVSQAVNGMPVQYDAGQYDAGQYGGGASCGDGSCGSQNVAGYGPGGFGVTTGYPYPGAGAASGGNGYATVGPMIPSGQTAGGAGFFFRYDRLYSSISAPGIRTIGSSAAEEIEFHSFGGATAFQNSLNTGFADDDFEFNGDRIEFGFLDGNGCSSGCSCGRCGSGWVASIMSIDQDTAASATGGTLLFDDPFGLQQGYADGNDDGIDDDLNNNYVYGRNGEDIGIGDPVAPGPPFDGTIDAPAPADLGDLVTWIPVYNELSARSYTSLSGLALSRFRDSNLRQGRGGCGGRCFKWLYGARYLNLNDRFVIAGRGGYTADGTLDLTGRAKNFIIGPEVGFCLDRSTGPWSLSGQLRFTAGTNFIRTQASGNMTMGDGSGQNMPISTTPITGTSTNETEQFSPIIEWRAGVAYALTHNLSVRTGYTGMFIGEVARGTGIEYTLPTFAIDNGRSDVYVHALTLGGEFVY